MGFKVSKNSLVLKINMKYFPIKPWSRKGRGVIRSYNVGLRRGSANGEDVARLLSFPLARELLKM